MPPQVGPTDLEYAISITTILISSGALGVAIKALMNSRKAVSAQVELDISERLAETRSAFHSASTQYLVAKFATAHEDEEKKKEHLKGLEQIVKSAIEGYISAYEDACGIYLDGKVDKKRFRANRHVELRQLVENDDMKAHFDSHGSPYVNIKNVYDMWEKDQSLS